MNLPPADTCERQLAERSAELLPGIGLEKRLELLGVMDTDDLRTSLAWLASHDLRLFDFALALVRDRALVERLRERLDNVDAGNRAPPVSWSRAELAARCTAATAVLADYQRSAAEGADVADRALWAARLGDMLGLMLAEFDVGNHAAAGESAAAQLVEIRLVLADAERVADNRQYALELIDDIVNRGHKEGR